MDKCITSKIVSCLYHKISTGNKITVDNKIGHFSDFRKILIRLTCDTYYIRPFFFDLTKCLCSPINCLINDDRLHIGIIRKINNNLNCCVNLLGKIIRIYSKCHLIFTILFLKCLSTSPVILRLGE